jgi:hypothetical protein
MYATPVICGGRIYLRVAQTNSRDVRQEWLYVIGSTGQVQGAEVTLIR